MKSKAAFPIGLLAAPQWACAAAGISFPDLGPIGNFIVVVRWGGFYLVAYLGLPAAGAYLLYRLIKGSRLQAAIGPVFTAGYAWSTGWRSQSSSMLGSLARGRYPRRTKIGFRGVLPASTDQPLALGRASFLDRFCRDAR
jgi:hypothetical protein